MSSGVLPNVKAAKQAWGCDKANSTNFVMPHPFTPCRIICKQHRLAWLKACRREMSGCRLRAYKCKLLKDRPCVVPSAEISSLTPVSNSRAGLRQVLIANVANARQRTLMLWRAAARFLVSWRLLTHPLATLSVSLCWNKLFIACTAVSLPDLCPAQTWSEPLDSPISCFVTFVTHFPITLLITSPTLIGRTSPLH